MAHLAKSVGLLLAFAPAATACSATDDGSSTSDTVADGVVTEGELGQAIAEVISCAADDEVLVVPLVDVADEVSFHVAAESQTVLDDCYEEHFRDVALFRADNP